MCAREIIGIFEKNANPASAEGMARFGIRGGHVYGLSIPFIRSLAKKIGKSHTLALDLHRHGSREARILAFMIAEPAETDDTLMEIWARAFVSWEICDQCCMCLFEKLPSAWTKAIEWSSRPEEYVKRAGFVLMARLAVSDKKADDGRFLPFLTLIEREAADNRAMVKKSVNWALRQIGKRNSRLHVCACDTARVLRELDSSSALDRP